MFSEYASRFLAQSQSRLSIGPPGNNNNNNNDPSSNRDRRSPSRLGSRFHPRDSTSNMPGPYKQSASQIVRFPFGSRALPPSAPLFYSATDDYREEDGREEHDREVADYYALQKSRRHFSQSRLSESSEADISDPYTRETPSNTGEGHSGSRHSSVGRASPWRSGPLGGRVSGKSPHMSPTRNRLMEDSLASSRGGQGRAKLVDVELSSSERSSLERVDPADLDGHEDDGNDEPPAFQAFTNESRIHSNGRRPVREHSWIPEESEDESAVLQPQLPGSDMESVQADVVMDPLETPRYDPFWATLFWVCFASLFASALLVWLHTDIPLRKNPLGDTIYSTLQKSYHLLAVDTLVAVMVAILWLALLRSFLRPLTYLMLVAVPVILFAFSLYPLISSFKGSWHGGSFQDKIMRTLAFLPMVGAVVWTYLSIKARHSVEKAIAILDFGTRILAASPALMIAGLVALVANVLWFWVWLALFTRVFLEGHWVPAGSKNLFVIDVSSWWLGAAYVLMLLWTQSIVSGIQRATSAATVSQWYFHRNASPSPSSRAVVLASFEHATSTLFGTICFSTFLSLAVRLPLLILPRRLVALFALCFYSIVPSPIAALTNPLTLTYAAIHSQPLVASAQGLSRMRFVSEHSSTTTLTPNAFNDLPASDSLIAYRTAKLILHSTRYVMALALGFAGWIATARLLQIDESYRGSLYAYVVGLGAAAIGWAVLGAMEGVVLGIIDAVVVCWGSEVGAVGRGQVRYCREAGDLLEDRKDYTA